MKALRRLWRRITRPAPTVVEAATRVAERRLRGYAVERKMRENHREAVWMRAWDAQKVQRNAEAQSRRSTYTVVPK